VYHLNTSSNITLGYASVTNFLYNDERFENSTVNENRKGNIKQLRRKLIVVIWAQPHLPDCSGGEVRPSAISLMQRKFNALLKDAAIVLCAIFVS
jgi:hypothetical protein